MMTIRKSNERGVTRQGWLDSKHSFSFGDYYDPDHMGFRALRVINDDRVGPGGGFGMHGHRDMEIVTYMVAGSLEHRDSLGSGEIMRRGDVQRMSAGTGIRHSEFNPSQTEADHLLQIWLLPERSGLRPEYAQRHFADADKNGRLRLVAARDGRAGALTIHQDADIYAALLAPGVTVSHRLKAGRHAWIQVAAGALTVNGQALVAGDGAAVTDVPVIELSTAASAEVLLFDMA
jgi:redox-sensitive bicupin YhaK (pirin superfamily)